MVQVKFNQSLMSFCKTRKIMYSISYSKMRKLNPKKVFLR